MRIQLDSNQPDDMKMFVCFEARRVCIAGATARYETG